jgi:serine/threonine-protein kinase
LSVAHRAGIVHRDLKPDNIFLVVDDLGRSVKLLDFGVSKVKGADSKLTGLNRLIGTPAYMSPEQADGRTHEIGPETDVWAMGAIIYEMATGHAAFAAASVPSILYRVCHEPPDPMHAFRSMRRRR